MDFTSESCNKLVKTLKFENKCSLYFQQPSCSEAEKEQAELPGKRIPEGLPVYNYKGEKNLCKEQHK